MAHALKQQQQQLQAQQQAQQLQQQQLQQHQMQQVSYKENKMIMITDDTYSRVYLKDTTHYLLF